MKNGVEVIKSESFFEAVSGRLKGALMLGSDAALAEALGMKPTAFANRKKSGSLPYDEIIALAESRKVNVGWVFTGEGAVAKGDFEDGVRSQVDPEALAGIIEGVEKSLAKRRLMLAPEKKAQVVSALYDYFMATGKPSAAAVERYLNMAS